MARRLLPNLPVWAYPLGAVTGLGVMAGLWFAFEAVSEVATLKTVGLNYDALKAYVAGNTGQAALLYIGAYALLGALILPGSPLLVVASGLLFGAGIGIPLSLFASMLAAIVTYLLVRTAFGRRMAAFPSPMLAKLRTGFQRHGLGYMMFLRLTPGLPFAALNVVPSLIGVSFSTFVTGTFLGLLPSRIALSTAGAGLGEAIKAQNALYSQCLAAPPAESTVCAYDLNVGSLLTKEMLGAFLALAILALIPAILDAARRVRERFRAVSKP
ncbi:MAG: VTT domain-containing protein [Hyphomicrobiaceae bacterium]